MLKRSSPHILALLLYLTIGVVLTWPLALHARTAVVGLYDGGDTYQNAWNQWWIGKALTSGRSPFFTDLLYYPEGVDLFWQTLGLSQGLVALPISLLFGPIAAVNVTLLGSFVIGGYAVFLFTRRLTTHNLAATVAGTIYICSPYHLQKLSEGSVELTSIHWLPLYVWALFALLEQPTVRRTLLAALLLVWVSFGAWYYALFAIFFTGSAVGIRILRDVWNARDRTPRLVAQQALLVAFWGLTPILCWALLLSPKLLTIGQNVDTPTWDLRSSQIERSADLLDIALPSALHPLWGNQISQWRTERAPNLQIYWNVSIGVVGFALALLGFCTDWRRNWYWGALLITSAILAMGPMLRIGGIETGIPLPFALIQNLPGVRIGQRPSHMAVFASLMAAILTAYAVAWLTRQRSGGIAFLISASLVTSSIAIDGLVASQWLTLYQRPVHPFYTTLPKPDGAILALPMYVNINRSEHLTNQMVHGWPIFAGYIARPPAYRFVYETNGISQLREGHAEPEDILSPGWPESGRRALAAQRIRYITLDLTSQRGDPKLAAGKPEYFAAVRRLLTDLGVGPALVADSDLEAYAILPDWPIGPTIGLGTGWHPLERDPSGEHWRWMGSQATLRLYNPYPQPVRASIRLRTASFMQQRELHLSLGHQAIGSIPIDTAPSVHTIHLLLPPGEQIITLESNTTADPAQGNTPLSVRVFGLEAQFSNP